MRLLPERSHAALRALAAKLRAGAAIPGELVSLSNRLGVIATAALLDVLADERAETERVADRRLEMVWSGPEQDGAGTRDTPAVVRDLFQGAMTTVIVSGYAVFDGATIFEPLATRIREVPGLQVRLFLNVTRPEGEPADDQALVRRFASRFWSHHWPWPERPTLYYDPRSLARDPSQRSVLHAKCIVVDGQRALVTSANLTEAAHYRNIECGVLVNDAVFARGLASQFLGLVERGIVRAVGEL